MKEHVCCEGVASNEIDIDHTLGLDPHREGAIAPCGPGVDPSPETA